MGKQITTVLGDMNALAIKVQANFTPRDMQTWPLGGHVLIVYFDPETGVLRGVEGTDITDEWLFDVRLENADAEPDQGFSAIAFHVHPLTDKEASQIADKVADAFGVETLNDIYDVGDGFSTVRQMLMMAARLGRGLDG